VAIRVPWQAAVFFGLNPPPLAVPGLSITVEVVQRSFQCMCIVEMDAQVVGALLVQRGSEVAFILSDVAPRTFRALKTVLAVFVLFARLLVASVFGSIAFVRLISSIGGLAVRLGKYRGTSVVALSVCFGCGRRQLTTAS